MHHVHVNSQPLSSEQLSQLEAIAREAGATVMSAYQSDEQGVIYKADNSPVTTADLASHRMICNRLASAFADIPVMSEEAADIPYTIRQNWSCYWLIDPLDGTKEFINRNGEFTVNIALIDHGRAVAGVVYAPVPDKCYIGQLGQGAWLIHQGHRQRLPISLEKRAVPVVVGSRSHPTIELAGYLDKLGEYRMLSVGSSLKFCMLAEGVADLYPRLGPTSEWDTAAAQAVLESAGGSVVDYVSGEPLRYNSKESLLNSWFIAIAPGINPGME
ncbi:MAG: 3'(2'),5'-bisphosphate nucleotidase CysQ [Shewanella sp.]|nr:3'(2'),5'-bisphosphate nucleotidase CysQ [Shewanella sp.]MCF1459369.1 3'(2'),5'-bisphosphate nucleotidase CysQ [Shewanella sp.]